jgi:hypothetical protein
MLSFEGCLSLSSKKNKMEGFVLSKDAHTVGCHSFYMKIETRLRH